MHLSKWKFKALLTSVSTIAAISLVGVGSASADYASFSSATNRVVGTGSITIERQGSTQAVTCPQVSYQGTILGGLYLYPTPGFEGTCLPDDGNLGNDYVTLGTKLIGQKQGSAYSVNSIEGFGFTPFGTLTPATSWSPVPAWTNATGSTPSTLQFVNTQIGYQGGGPVRITGTFQMSDGSGGNVVLK